jgi:hypothetical protein
MAFVKASGIMHKLQQQGFPHTINIFLSHTKAVLFTVIVFLCGISSTVLVLLACFHRQILKRGIS